MGREIGFGKDHLELPKYTGFYRVGLPNGGTVEGVLFSEIAGRITLLPHLVFESFPNGSRVARLEENVPSDVYTPAFKQPISKELVYSYLNLSTEFKDGSGI